jgi:hypothetical protein
MEIYASEKGYTDIVKTFLFNKNVDVNIQNNYGKTAYDLVKTDEIKNLLLRR